MTPNLAKHRRAARLSAAAVFAAATLPLAVANPALALPAAPAVAAEAGGSEGYAHDAVYTVPDGWRLEGTGVLVGPDAPRGHSVKIVVGEPDAARRGLRACFAADVAEASQKMNNFRTESEVEEASHPGGFAMLRQTVSWSSGALNGTGLNPFGRTFILLYHLDAGGDAPSQPVMLVASSRELLDAHRATFEGFVRDVRLTGRVQLAPGVAGQPPLTLRTALRFDGALEWLLDVTLSDAQRGAVHRHLADAWRKGDVAEMNGVREMPEVREKVAAMPAEQGELVRKGLRSESLKSWRADARAGDVGASIVLGIYYASQKLLTPVSKNEPPLTREVADAMLDTLYFMASMTVSPGGAQARPAAELREKWVQGLAAQWAAKPAAEKEGLSTLPGLAAALRLAWNGMSAGQKAGAVAEWAKLPPVKVIADQIRSERAPAARPDRLHKDAALGRAQSQVNLYNQLSAYGALRMNHTYIKW